MDINDLLKKYGLTLKILSDLSYKSNLGQSLKNDLKYFDKNTVLDELTKVTEFYDEIDLSNLIDIDFRIKSIDSIKMKFDRYYPDHQLRKVFNDILGLRALCDDYNDILTIHSEDFRIADMSNGKANDDGYRGVHIYYQKDNNHYPIEIQFNTYFDRQLNDWLHDYVYKKNYSIDVGKRLRVLYENGKINNINKFKEELENVLHSSKK